MSLPGQGSGDVLCLPHTFSLSSNYVVKRMVKPQDGRTPVLLVTTQEATHWPGIATLD